MLSHPLINFEIIKCYQSEPKFNGVYSRNNLPKVKNGAYVMNLDECKSIEPRQVSLQVDDDNGSPSYDTTYFDSLVLEYIPIDFMLKEKKLVDYTSSFSPNRYEKNDKIITK